MENEAAQVATEAPHEEPAVQPPPPNPPEMLGSGLTEEEKTAEAIDAPKPTGEPEVQPETAPAVEPIQTHEEKLKRMLREKAVEPVQPAPVPPTKFPTAMEKFAEHVMTLDFDELKRLLAEGEKRLAKNKREMEENEAALGLVRMAIYKHPRNGFTDAQWAQKLENEALQAAQLKK